MRFLIIREGASSESAQPILATTDPVVLARVARIIYERLSGDGIPSAFQEWAAAVESELGPDEKGEEEP